VWTDPVDESLQRLGIWLFIILACAVSAGRSLWFFVRSGVRPVAPPRDRSERIWHWVFISIIILLAAICTVRLFASDYFYLFGPIQGADIYIFFWPGLAAVILGFAFMLVAQSQMGGSWRIGIPGDRTELVITGIYRYTRNPIYLGFFAGMIGFMFLLPSAATIIVFLLTFRVLAEWASREEQHQLEMHGGAFREYCKRTGRFFPRFK